MPVAPKIKAPFSVESRSSVSHLDQLLTSVQMPQIVAGGAVVVSVWLNFISCDRRTDMLS